MNWKHYTNAQVAVLLPYQLSEDGGLNRFLTVNPMHPDAPKGILRPLLSKSVTLLKHGGEINAYERINSALSDLYDKIPDTVKIQAHYHDKMHPPVVFDKRLFNARGIKGQFVVLHCMRVGVNLASPIRSSRDYESEIPYVSQPYFLASASSTIFRSSPLSRLEELFRNQSE